MLKVQIVATGLIAESCASFSVKTLGENFPMRLFVGDN